MGVKRSILVAVCLIAGSLGAPAVQAVEGPPPRPPAHAVIALVDTGINPYHEVFRDDSSVARAHPSTYIPGFPKDAEALRLSLHEKDYTTAVKKDCDQWKSVESGKLYWIPGTKIIGAITFEPTTGTSCTVSTFESPGILDGFGHGTMVASRAAGNGYGACPDCRVVAVQGTHEGVRWASENSGWIDVQSNSWGPIVPAWAPAEDDSINYNTPGFVRDVEASARKHLAVWATGNGAATRGGVLGHPTFLDPRMTPSIVMAGGHDSGYINTWPGFPPHVVADSCSSWAAYQNHISKSADTVGSGTSAATPWIAGSAARMLLDARRLLWDGDTGVEKGVAARGAPRLTKGPLADGRLKLTEWKEVLFKTATPRPKGQKEDGPSCGPVEGLVIHSSTPVRWEQVPEGYPEYLHIGYGAVDDPSVRLAWEVLTGHKPLPDRAATDQYFTFDGMVRGALHGVFSSP